LGRLSPLLPEVEHRVYKIHIRVYRLLGKRLRSLYLALLLLGDLLARLPSALCLGTQVLYRPVEEVLGKASVLLLYVDTLLRSSPHRLHEGISELLGRLVHPLLLLLVHKVRSPLLLVVSFCYQSIHIYYQWGEGLNIREAVPSGSTSGR